MKICRTLTELSLALAPFHAQRDDMLALVPTMGALHAGHLSLIAAARREAALVAASIFVNPTQFGPNEDLARYPRDEAGDLAKLKDAGCDLVWLPSVQHMYPQGDSTLIEPAGPALGWEGESRPGHFRGVATVVTKLFGQVQPQLALFGEKDWQQLQVIKRTVTDLFLPVRVIGVPIAREDDGLAMSSRNRFLSPQERALAPQIHAGLQRAAHAIRQGETPATALSTVEADWRAAGFEPDYLALVDEASLERVNINRPGLRLLTTVRLGSVRLLDNIALAPM